MEGNTVFNFNVTQDPWYYCFYINAYYVAKSESTFWGGELEIPNHADSNSDKKKLCFYFWIFNKRVININ